VRARLLGAATEEFRARGYAGARLDVIARAAGFTKGAVYSNFDSKQGLFTALLAHHADALLESLLAGVDGVGVDEGVRRIGLALGARVVADPQWHLLVLELAVQAGRDDVVRRAYTAQRRAQRAALAELVRDRADQWGAVGLDGTAAAQVLLAVLLGLTVEHAADPVAVGEAEIATAVSTVLAGLLAAAGARPAGAG
jgi:AcrR family transcriptional regulator